MSCWCVYSYSYSFYASRNILLVHKLKERKKGVYIPIVYGYIQSLIYVSLLLHFGTISKMHDPEPELLAVN
jgi:hypothetical protein